MPSPSDQAPSPPPARADDLLVRAIGVRALAANVVNNIVGSGIFVLPAAVAVVLGPSSAIAYVVCAVAIGLVALCIAEIGSRVSVTGGLYAYLEAAFGPYVGFLAGVLLWFGSEAVASAAVAVVCAGSLLAMVPGEHGPLARDALLLAIYALLAVVNVRGVRTGARVMEVLTFAKIAPLVLLVVGGAFFIRPSYLGGVHLPSIAELGRGSMLLVFAFTGIEGALSASGEVASPSRTVPRAVLLGLALVVLVYGGLQVVSQGLLGPALATEQSAPLAAAAASVAGGAGRMLVLFGATLSTFGYLSGDVLASPRLLFAFAEGGVLPARLAAVHPRFRTPHVAIVAHTVICAALALSGTFQSLAVLSAVSALLLYLGCCAAVLVLRRRGTRAEGAPFRVAGGAIVPVLGAAVVIWLLASASRAEYLGNAAMLGVATVFYGARRWLPRSAPVAEVP